MAAIATPIVLVAGTVLAMSRLAEGDAEQALAYALGSLALAALCGGLFLGLFYAAYPLASDWITEWAGYAFGFGIAALALLAMAVLLFLTPLPAYIAVLVPLLAAFATGCGIAGRLAGMGAPSARPRTRARTLRRP
jgi:hypothetical protein